MQKGIYLMPRGKQKAPEGETKAQAFKRIGEPRINNALTAIGRLESLANKTTYEYTTDQVKIITDNLTNAVQRVTDAFAGKSVSAGGVSL
jgi:hypothetical protein